MSDSNVEVIMPLMGEGINEATLVRWLKKSQSAGPPTRSHVRSDRGRLEVRVPREVGKIWVIFC